MPRMPKPPGTRMPSTPPSNFAAPSTATSSASIAPDDDAGVVGDPGVVERLVDRLVGVAVADVLADDGDRHLAAGVADALDQLAPVVDLQGAGFQAQAPDQEVVEPIIEEAQGDLVNGEFLVALLDHGAALDVAEEGDLVLFIGADRVLRTANQDIRLNTDLAKGPHRVLCRLRLQLTGGPQVGDEGQVNVDAVFPADIEGELADRLQKGESLDVADRAADFGDDDVDVVGGQRADACLDLVGDVGNDLDRLALVELPLALLLDDGEVNLASGVVAVAGQGGVGEAFVVAQVEVGFRAVVQDVDLAVLVGAHGPGVDVDVRVELLEPHAQPPALQQQADGGTREPLAQRADHTPRHENMLGHQTLGPPWNRPRRTCARC